MLKHIRTALALYTCIPRRVNNTPSTADRRKAASYLPLIGWIIGGCAGFGFYYCAQYFSTFTAALLATAISILFTSAVHEKGLAHTCDELANVQPKERAANAPLGIHGTLGLMFVILLKVSLVDDAFFLHGYLRDEVYIVVLIFICAHTLSRFMASTLIHFSGIEENTPKKTPRSLLLIALSGLIALAPLVLLIELSYRSHYILILPPMMAATWAIYEYLKKRSANNHFHSLGAVQQVNELVCLGTFALIL